MTTVCRFAHQMMEVSELHHRSAWDQRHLCSACCSQKRKSWQWALHAYRTTRSNPMAKGDHRKTLNWEVGGCCCFSPKRWKEKGNAEVFTSKKRKDLVLLTEERIRSSGLCPKRKPQHTTKHNLFLLKIIWEWFFLYLRNICIEGYLRWELTVDTGETLFRLSQFLHPGLFQMKM